MTSRVLIGDDNEQMLRSLGRVMRMKGLEADLSTTPEEVIEKAKTGDYFAVVTDLEYTEGGREGFQVLDAIKDIDSVKILYTARREFEVVADGLVNGADYVIPGKDSSQLFEVLSKSLEKRR